MEPGTPKGNHFSEWPEHGYEQHCYTPEYEIQWSSNPGKVSEPVSSRGIDHGICLISYGCCEASGCGKGNGHQKSLRIHLHGYSEGECNRGEYYSRSIV